MRIFRMTSLLLGLIFLSAMSMPAAVAESTGTGLFALSSTNTSNTSLTLSTCLASYTLASSLNCFISLE